MRVLVVGSGGREHALASALAADPSVTAVAAAPGNPGIGQLGELFPAAPTDADAVAGAATAFRADLVVVGPEAALVAGATDAVQAAGIACFGPTRAAAELEGSKTFAKDVMAAAGVPTARSYSCTTEEQVAAALDEFGAPHVVKDDSLAAGKGVVVTDDRSAALEHAAGCDRVVVEEFLDGPEISLFVVTDGTTAVPMLLAQDYKRVGTGDTGPNTGGMGAYAPITWAGDAMVPDVLENVVHPVLKEMADRGAPFAGLLYVGLCLTDQGPRVIEFNVRFGDPEAQVLLPLLRTSPAELFYRAATGTLEGLEPLRWHDKAAVTVVIASKGYPEQPSSGDCITGVDGPGYLHAGTRLTREGRLVTSGGRALCCTALGNTLDEARTAAYELAGRVTLAGAVMRSDIGLPSPLTGQR
ncbi:phosphoribosylamine--glycine ligase [Paractinoplanes ferrugineus]|uniref:Phosphoribosylamine--glycine ligase n=1 Tax=Paractinoplanes ferrugineus TaxID=113564 RepID=A0A919J5I9_9ACTN|nr:phosphoribosylamine--glycine ligase [Actinoplanes ferrugineus]GIE14270.1 phosphoribosylamine--glycine ligase [Actinoplanes ferrugineus]